MGEFGMEFYGAMGRQTAVLSTATVLRKHGLHWAGFPSKVSVGIFILRSLVIFLLFSILGPVSPHRAIVSFPLSLFLSSPHPQLIQNKFPSHCKSLGRPHKSEVESCAAKRLPQIIRTFPVCLIALRRFP